MAGPVCPDHRLPQAGVRGAPPAFPAAHIPQLCFRAALSSPCGPGSSGHLGPSVHFSCLLSCPVRALSALRASRFVWLVPSLAPAARLVWAAVGRLPFRLPFSSDSSHCSVPAVMALTDSCALSRAGTCEGGVPHRLGLALLPRSPLLCLPPAPSSARASWPMSQLCLSDATSAVRELGSRFSV